MPCPHPWLCLSAAGGVVTTVVGSEEELSALRAIAQQLKFELTEEAEDSTPQLMPPGAGQEGAQAPDIDSMRKGLEDLFNLM